MISYKQAIMQKQAGLLGNTMLGRWITDQVGPGFVADTLGASQQDMIQHELDQLGFHAPTGGQPGDYYDQVNKHIDQRLAEVQARQQREAQLKNEQMLAEQQAQASRNNEDLMAAYMSGDDELLGKQNQMAAEGNAITNNQLGKARSNAIAQVRSSRPKQQIAGTQESAQTPAATPQPYQGAPVPATTAPVAPAQPPRQRGVIRSMENGQQVTYTSDVNGNMTRTAPNGQTTNVYTRPGRGTAVITANGKTTTMAPNGQITTTPVANATPAPNRPAAPKPAPRMTGQQAFQNQLNPQTRSAAGRRALAASDAAIRRRDSKLR